MDLPKLTLSMLCSPGTQLATVPSSFMSQPAFFFTGSSQRSSPVA